jgi:hypothetical protein
MVEIMLLYWPIRFVYPDIFMQPKQYFQRQSTFIGQNNGKFAENMI